LHAGQVGDAIRQADPVPVAIAVALIGVIYSVQAVRWRWIARRSAVLPWRTFLRLIISSVAVNNVIPGRPGEVLRGYWLGRAGDIPQARALSTVVIDRSSDVLLLVVAFAAAFPFVSHPSWLQHVFVAALVVAGLIAAALAVARLHTGGRRLAPARLPAGLRNSWSGRQLAGLAHGTGALVNRRDAVVLALLTATVWGCWAFAAWLVAGSLGISMSPLEVVFLTAVINLGAAIPSSPGFVGTFQWLCVSGMALFGVGQAEALAFSIIMQGVWYIPSTAIGLVLLTHRGLSAWLSGGMPDLSTYDPATRQGTPE
jgi:glycosyltransferase 2 family protein